MGLVLRRRARRGARAGTRRWAVRLVVALAVVGGSGGLAIVGEAVVRARLTPLSAPTRYYARPFVVVPGARLDPNRMQRQLEVRGYAPAMGAVVGMGRYARRRGAWIVGRRAFRIRDRLDPGGRVTLHVGRDDRVDGITDNRGRSVSAFVLEPHLLAIEGRDGAEDRVPVPLADVAPVLIDAVVAVEDRRFYEHRGVDLARIVGAAWANLRSGRVKQGGSTLTQQLAKNLFLRPHRTPIRKLRDMAMAWVLERRYSKAEILEAYLNVIYLGHADGVPIHGVGRAAQYYFGKDVSQLSVGDAALLVGIIRGPNLYAPFRHPDAARARRDLVLQILREREVVSEADRARLAARPLALRGRAERPRVGRYFLDYVRDRLVAQHGRAWVRTGGGSVFTTLDPEWQAAAERAVREGLTRLERDLPALREARHPLQAALVAIEPSTGEIRALVGGRDYGASQFNRATQARRQPGSAFKPVVALAALTGRSGITLASTLRDEPFAIETPAGRWEPANYDGRFRGPVSLREALERSLNVPFARLGVAVGPDRVVDTARRLGFAGSLPPVPSLALGAGEVTPLEMARAFGVFAAAGYRAETHATLAVLDAGGEPIQGSAPAGQPVFTPAETYLVTSALGGVVDRGTGRALRRWGYRGPVAAKSGTSNDFRDAWFVGYTPGLAVAVWVGFDAGEGTGLTGSGAALPIFARFVRAVDGGTEADRFAVPSGIDVARVRERGRWRCVGPVEVFLEGTTPPEACTTWGDRWRRWQVARRRGSRRGDR